jgi:hypothetical protein
VLPRVWELSALHHIVMWALFGGAVMKTKMNLGHLETLSSLRDMGFDLTNAEGESRALRVESI